MGKSKVTTIPIPLNIHKKMVEYQKYEVRRYLTVSGKKGKRTAIPKLAAHIMKIGFKEFLVSLDKIKKEVEIIEKVESQTIHDLINKQINK